MSERRKNKNKRRKRNAKMAKEAKKKAAFMSPDSPSDNRTTSNSIYKFNPYDSYVAVPVLTIEKEERDKHIKLMRSIFEVQSYSGNQYDMIAFITEFVKKLGDDTISFDLDESHNIYITKGKADTYPCVVAHMDTVHRLIPDEDYVVLNSKTEFFAINMATKSQTGIGGDDNNGIFCALDNLIREDKIKVAFFVDEEIGCVGSSNSRTEWFKDTSFILQADRQGYTDVAQDIMYTNMFDADFLMVIRETLDKYSREVCEGGMTDVMQLANNGVGVAMANFSCGYYKPHTDREYVVIDELILTSILFRDIIRVAYVDGERHEMDRVPENDGYSYGYDYYGYGYSVSKPVQDSTPLIEGDIEGSTFDRDDESIHSKPMLDTRKNEDCTYCGQVTLWDATMELGFCNNCMDYDYNNSPVYQK